MVFGILLPFIIGYASAWYITRKVSDKYGKFLSFPLAMILAIGGTWVFAMVFGSLIWSPEDQERVVSLAFWIGPFSAALPILTQPRGSDQ